MSRISLVMGPTTVLHIAAALRHREPQRDDWRDLTLVYLIGEAAVSERLLCLTRKVAELLLPGSNFRPWSAAQDKKLRILDDVADSSSELWISRPFFAPEMRLFLRMPQATIRIYDEGISTYRPCVISGPVTSEEDLLQRPHASVPVNLLARIASLHTLVRHVPTPAWLAGAPRIDVPASFMQDALAQIAITLRPDLPAGWENRPRTAVVVGTAFSLWRQLPWDVEAEHYAQTIRHLLRGGDPVLYVPHPRLLDPFERSDQWTDLVADKGLTIWQPGNGLPLEILALTGRIGLGVSISSSALLTLRDWFGTPVMLMGSDRIYAALARQKHVILLTKLLPTYLLPQERDKTTDQQTESQRS